MGKYKICPNINCNAHCKMSLVECTECGHDITNVAVTDESQILVSEEDIQVQSNFIRVCENCNEKNNVGNRKCSECGEDISDIAPLTGITSNFYIVSSDEQYIFAITKPLHILGRENEVSEYFQNYIFTSNTHAKIITLESQLYITDVSRNGTWVNDIKISKDAPFLLNDKDMVSFGGTSKQEKVATFIVKVNLC